MRQLTLLGIPAVMAPADHRRAADEIVELGLDGLAVHAMPEIAEQREVYDLDFLQHYPRIRALGIGAPVRSLDPVESLADHLEVLSTGAPARGSSGFAPVAACRKLTDIDTGASVAELAPLAGLPALCSFTGRGDAEVIELAATFPRLRRLDVATPGRLQSLSGLERCPALEQIEMSLARKVADVSALAGVPTLQVVGLDYMRQVQSLPDLRHLPDLHTVYLRTMNGLVDLDGLRGSTVRDLGVIGTKMSPDAFARLASDLPDVRQVVLWLNGARATAAAQAHFPAGVIAPNAGVFERYYRDGIRRSVAFFRRPPAPSSTARLGRGIVVRPAGEADVTELADIWHGGWHEANDGRVADELVVARPSLWFRTRIYARIPQIWLATVDGVVAGFVTPGMGEVEHLYVSPAHARRGGGAALLAHAEDWIHQIGFGTAWAAVAPGNAGGRAFLERYGWSAAGDLTRAEDTPSGPIDVTWLRYEKALG